MFFYLKHRSIAVHSRVELLSHPGLGSLRLENRVLARPGQCSRTCLKQRWAVYRDRKREDMTSDE